MKTITVQIGNSDDKLTQKEWSEFTLEVHESIMDYSNEIHFSGGSYFNAPWQNAAWIFTVSSQKTMPLRELLLNAAVRFRQDSIAWTEGVTTFISPGVTNG